MTNFLLSLTPLSRPTNLSPIKNEGLSFWLRMEEDLRGHKAITEKIELLQVVGEFGLCQRTNFYIDALSVSEKIKTKKTRKKSTSWALESISFW